MASTGGRLAIPTTERASNALVGLVTEALSQEHLEGLSAVLERLSRAVGAYGSILWEVGPGATFDPPEGWLYVLAEWFEDQRVCALHDLPLERSLTGASILDRTTQSSADTRTDDRVWHGDGFLEKAKIRSLCARHLGFADGTAGALTVYRREPGKFTRSQLWLVEQAAELLPYLYQTLRDRVSYTVLSTVKSLFDRVDSDEQDLSKDRMREILREVCAEISRTFTCIEAAIYLEDPGERPGFYDLMATTWPERSPRASYTRDETEGLTAWVLQHETDVRIFDLRYFERDLVRIQENYPGITLNDLAEIERAVAMRSGGEVLTPLSFMAAPIHGGTRVIGVIRCFAATRGPYYFGTRELDLLRLLGHEIGQRWDQWLRDRAVEEENRSWHTLVRSITDLNRFVYLELNRRAPDEITIFNEALRVTQSVIHSAELSDVRLVDEEHDELYFAATYGAAWDGVGTSLYDNPRERRFPLNDPRHPSAGTHVVASGRTYSISDVSKEPYYDGTFSDTRRMIVAPISVEDKIFGVLDVRGIGPTDFPPHAEDIAALLGKQLGLYHHLAITIRRLQEAEVELSQNLRRLQTLQDQQNQAYEDLTHQLRSPITQAHLRIQNLISDKAIEKRLDRRLRAIRGLCGKAKHVAMSTGLYVDLARDQPIRIRAERLEYHDLIRVLTEEAADAEIMLEPDREVRFVVERNGLRLVKTRIVEVDHALLGQVIADLLDNAGKYAYRRTNVRIFGGSTGGGRFHLTVASQGLRIRSNEATSALSRGWRSEGARLTTAEGSGIGLWIANHIMKAHGGDVVVMPTTDQGWTEIKLVFPIRSRKASDHEDFAGRR